MAIPEDLRQHYAGALADARAVVARVGSGDLARPTPCRGWDLRALTGHMVGQNEGFATAIAHGDAPVQAYAPRPVDDPDALVGAWDESARHLLEAVDACDPDRPVRLVEIAPEGAFPAQRAVRMQLLDTVVHTWDVATALGRHHRPGRALLDLVAASAAQVPGGAARTRPGAAFAPSLQTATPSSTTDPWALTLARLGRDPGNA